MEDPCKVAVIMSTFAEKPEWLRASIESILSQTFGRFMFYIALDDPGNQEVKRIVEAYAAEDERIVVVEHQRNRGLVDTLNELLLLSEETCVARMDADDIALPERLQSELRYMEENGLDMVMCGADIISGGAVVPGRKLPDLSPESLEEAQKHTNVSFHSSWLVKRGVYEALGGYRPMGRCEDYDFILRALQAGFRIGRMSGMLMQYRLAEDGISSMGWMEQELNARYLRERFKAGVSIEGITPEEVGALVTDASSEEKTAYAVAKRSYDELFASVESCKLAKAASIALRGASNPIFRRKMKDVVRERRALARICKDQNG